MSINPRPWNIPASTAGTQDDTLEADTATVCLCPPGMISMIVMNMGVGTYHKPVINAYHSGVLVFRTCQYTCFLITQLFHLSFQLVA